MAIHDVEPSNGSRAPMPGRVSWRTLAAIFVTFLPLLAPARARADLSAISGDTIFGTNIVFQPASGVTVNGIFAVGPNGSLSGGGGLVINNPGGVALDLGTNATFTGATTGPGSSIKMGDTNLAGLTGPSGSIQQASTAFANLTATQTVGNFGGGTLTLQGNGGLNVVDVQSFQSGGIVLKGTSNDIFVINVASLSAINGGVTLENLSGGSSGAVTANHVLFNIENTSGGVQLSGILNGTFLIPSVAATFSGAASPFTGAIYDGSTVTMDITETSSPLTMNGASFTDYALVSAPEPAPFVKGISGLATIGIWGFFRLRRSRSK